MRAARSCSRSLSATIADFSSLPLLGFVCPALQLLLLFSQHVCFPYSCCGCAGPAGSQPHRTEHTPGVRLAEADSRPMEQRLICSLSLSLCICLLPWCGNVQLLYLANLPFSLTQEGLAQFVQKETSAQVRQLALLACCFRAPVHPCLSSDVCCVRVPLCLCLCS